MRRAIPGRHAVILAKVSELSNGKLPLEALEGLYWREIDKYGMISKFQEEIREEFMNVQEEKG